MEMSIADLLKYKEQLVKKLTLLDTLASRVEVVKVTQRVVPNTTTPTTSVVEQIAPTLSIQDVTSARDGVSKEIRLVSQVIEKLNHTTVIEFNAQY